MAISWPELHAFLALIPRTGANRLGDCHVTQTAACDGCRSFTQRGHPGFNTGVRMVRGLARWMGLGRWMGTRLESRMGTWLGRARLESWMGPGLGRLGVAPSMGLGLGRTALRCGPRILRRRMRRSTSGPRPMGSALDFSESVLVTEKVGR